MGGGTFRALRAARPSLGAVAWVICFGLVGLIWSLPRLRGRRLRGAATCRPCAAHHGARNVAVFVVAGLLGAGSIARLQTTVAPQIRCHSHITADGTIRPEPMLDISPPAGWGVSRSVLVAPISGVGVLTGWALGMESCSGPPLLVMFWPPPRTSSGGSTIGDVFVAWMPPSGPTGGALSVDGYGIANEESYLRYGPNISQARVDEEQLGYHESRHVDQWAMGTLLAGPFAFPFAYFIDGAFFPGSRNHFERDARLSRGGYPPVEDGWPAPLWPQAAGLTLVAAVIWRRRLRWLTRAALGGRQQLHAHSPGRCPVHTTGWRPPR